MSARKHVIVIGGGVIGTACAHFLQQTGRRVTVIDQATFGKQCSHGNCGFVCPSHVLPLAVPGAIGGTLKSLFTPNSPFRIRPRISPTLWRWLLSFARRCNRHDMMESAKGIHALLTSSRQLYDELRLKESIECEWESRGLLFVFQSKHGMDHYARTHELIQTNFGVDAERFDGPKLNELEPALKQGLGGGWLYRTDAHLRPDRLMSSWRRLLENRGVEIRENVRVLGFQRQDAHAVAVRTDQGDITADEFVVSAGALTPFLNDHLGCRIPIQPGKGYSITMPRPKRCPTIPMIFEEHRVAVTPMQTGYRLGSMMEFVGYDSTVSPKRLEWLSRSAAVYLDEPTAEPVQETWYGWRPMTTDSRPIIDRSPSLTNVVIAAGHNMLGLSMAPGTGRLVAEILDGRARHIDANPYSVVRFGRI